MAPGGYTQIRMLVGGVVLKMREGAANIPTWTGLNGQTSRQEYQQGDPVVILKLGPFFCTNKHKKCHSKRNEL